MKNTEAQPQLSNPVQPEKIEEQNRIKTVAGGSATERGLDYQARVAAIALTYILLEQKISWIDGVFNGVPVLVDAETGGPGDDIAFATDTGKSVEVQVKRGLKRNTDLWDALCALAKGIHDDSIACGILVVCPNSSSTIRSNLADNIIRIGTGRTDGLHEIGGEFIKRVGLNPQDLSRVCSALRIVTVDAIDGNNSAEINAINQLTHLFHEPLHAWSVLVEHARKLIRIRGRATMASLLNELRNLGICIKMDTTESGIQLRAAVCKWLEESYSQFTIPGQAKPVSLQKCWIPLKASIIENLENFPDDLTKALISYHQYAANRRSNINKFDAYTLGRYVTQGIIIGGPGIGKSVLLRRIALTYAAEGHMVLLARLSQVVSLISHKGIRFEEALNDVALSCSGLRYKSLDLNDAVILCDGLDECGANQHLITDAIHKFAVAHPKTRILLTSRPVGYRAGLLGNWRHYELLPLEESQTDDALKLVMEALPFDNPEARNQTLDVAKEQLKSLHLKGVASRSPLILTMLASLSSRGIEPGCSLISLYRQLFKLLETAYPSARFDGPVPTEPERNWFIFLLGWILFEHGTEPFELTFKHCVSEWQKETRDGHLACSNKVQACFDFWENVGVIEQIHTLDQEAVTFVHKTFAEYAAAVFIERQSHDLKRNLLIKAIQGDSSHGILSFASHLGLVDEIIDVWNELLLRGEAIPSKELNQVLNLIIEAGIPVNKDSLHTFTDCCWKAISSSASMFSAGEALCQVSIYNWDIVRDSVRANLNSNDNWLWLVSWACTLAGNAEEVSYQDAIIALKSIHSKWPKRLSKRNSLFGSSNGRKIQDSIILGAAEIILQSPENIGLDTLNAVINKGKGLSVNCFFELSKLYAQAGIKLQDEVNRSSYTVQDYLTAHDKINAKWLDLISVLAGDDNTLEPGDILPENMIELGAFLSASGFHHLSLSDLRRLEETDKKFIHRRNFLYKITKSAGIDLNKLRHQSASFKRQCQGNVAASVELSCRLPIVDAFVKPENIDINPDDFGDLLETILYGSQFYSSLAAIILYEHREHPRVIEGIKYILMEGEGAALHIVTHLMKGIPDQNWQPLLLQRLETAIPQQGSSCLFEALTQPFNLQHENIVKQGLRNKSLNAALASASFATKLPQTDGLLHELGPIYEEWKHREEPYPEDIGVIPDSPRDALSGILVKGKGQNNVELIVNMVQEKRTKIRETGEKALLNALSNSAVLQGEISHWVRDGMCKAVLLRQIITDVPLAPEAVTKLIPFLKHESAELRYAATALFNTQLMEHEQIQLFAQELSNDPEVEIRESASAALSSLYLGQGYNLG